MELSLVYSILASSGIKKNSASPFDIEEKIGWRVGVFACKTEEYMVK